MLEECQISTYRNVNDDAEIFSRNEKVCLLIQDLFYLIFVCEKRPSEASIVLLVNNNFHNMTAEQLFVN